MARNDYFTMLGKILVFLYRRLKERSGKAPEDYIVPNSRDFPVSEGYLNYVLSEMDRHGYIMGVTFVRAWGGDVIRANGLENIQITQEGIAYMIENSTARKVIQQLPGAAAIAELFT